MTHIRVKLLVAGALFAGALGYLAFAGMQKGWVYTLAVDTYLADPAYRPQRVRLTGHVADEGLEVNAAALSAKFVLKGHTQQIPVAYHGVVPDMFKAGGEVLVEGQRDAAGVFQANVMMTKCASKYDEAPKGHPTNRQLTEASK